MKPWQVLFRMAPKRDHDTQGDSTGDDDFTNEAEDDALALEGEEELGEEDDDTGEPEEDSEDDQSDEDQDGEEEEAGEEGEEQEEEASAEDRFKDPKTGDFDFKRINKAIGGDFLEKRIKEADATITRTFQELKSYKEIGPPEKVAEFRTKASFLDNLVDNNPTVQQEVLKALGVVPQGGNGGRSAPAAAGQLPPGVHPEDPLLPILMNLQHGYQAIENRHLMAERQRQVSEQQARFSLSLDTGMARFKELTGKAMTAEQQAALEQEMKQTGYLNAANLVPSLFWKEIQGSMSRNVVAKRMAKKNLPKAGASRRPAPGKSKKRGPREDDRDDLWEKHMGSGIED